MDAEQYRQSVARLDRHQGGLCPICGWSLRRGGKLDYHHVVHDTKVNRKLYPRLVAHPVLAKALLHHDCHLSNPSWGKWSERKCRWYEWRLQNASEEGT